MYRTIQRVCAHFNMTSLFKKLKLWFECHKLKPNCSMIHHINCTTKGSQRIEQVFMHADEHTALVKITVNHK